MNICKWFDIDRKRCCIDIPDSVYICSVDGDISKACPLAIDREHLREDKFREREERS